ncbi:MAG: LPS-assembly protein LptD [Fimbriimonadaceae bacterium]|nr:LPS-assembly protein LptD [Fimbriimonadaceae bacterium]
MKRWTVSLFSLASAAAFGQSGLAQLYSTAIAHTGQDPAGNSQTPPDARQDPNKPPLQPTGFPAGADADGRLPTPVQGQNSDRVVRILSTNSQLTRMGDIVTIKDKVHVLYRGYDIFADEVVGNLRTSVFVLRGNASLVGEDAVIKGERLEVDFDTKKFRTLKIDAELRPSLLGGETLSSVYVRGGEGFGTDREFTAHDSLLTTCEKEIPHYHIDSKMMEVRPGKRIILRKAGFDLLGHKLFTIPYLVIPLDDRNQRYAPEIGQTQEEGWFIRNTIGIPVSGNNALSSYLDYYEKLGPGIGGRFAYDSENAAGFVRAYNIAGDTQSLEVVSSHIQRFGSSIFSLDNNFQKRNFFNSPQNTSMQTRASLLFPQRGATTRLSFIRSANESTNFESVTQAFAISDQRTYGLNTRTLLDLSWNRYNSQSGSNTNQREQLDVRFNGRYDLSQALAELDYQRSIPIGENKNFFGAIERTPVLTLSTDSRRLLGRGTKTDWPFSSLLSVGQFTDQRIGDTITRYFFEFNLNRPDNGRSRFGMQTNARFQQRFYSDDTAQYVTTLNTALRYNLGDRSAFNLRYSYLQPEGFTPLNIDRSSRTSYGTAELNFQLSSALRIGAQSGFDALRSREGEVGWQPVGVRMEWQPTDGFLMRGQTTYDPRLSTWSNLTLDMGYAHNDTFLSIGARYDGIRQVWGNFNVYLDGFRVGRTRVAALLTYNGYLKKFDSKHYSLIYDLHCAEAVLEVLENNFGFRSGREVYFSIRLKAFPFGSNFGTGTRGQPIGIGTGSGF